MTESPGGSVRQREVDAAAFCGSYLAEDVRFLLRPLDLAPTPVAEKERLIQSGQRHYSEMISLEQPPSLEHKALFQQAFEQGGGRMAREVAALASALASRLPHGPIVLASLVRAGVPLGILLRRALRRLGRGVHHYGISIIRDRGIDRQALHRIVAWHGPENLVFVDGWTGKGAIAGELARSLRDEPGFPGEPRLVTLADPCGRAWLAASGEDWLIPSGILGGTVSGLLSRSVWTEQGLHGCMFWRHLSSHDVSREFITEVDSLHPHGFTAPATWTEGQRRAVAKSSGRVIERVAKRFAITNRNRIKPGIAEATRALLRRLPDQVLVRDPGDADVRLLLHLAERLGVPVQTWRERLGPYRAVTVIKRVC